MSNLVLARKGKKTFWQKKSFLKENDKNFDNLFEVLQLKTKH